MFVENTLVSLVLTRPIFLTRRDFHRNSRLMSFVNDTISKIGHLLSTCQDDHCDDDVVRKWCYPVRGGASFTHTYVRTCWWDFLKDFLSTPSRIPFWVHGLISETKVNERTTLSLSFSCRLPVYVVAWLKLYRWVKQLTTACSSGFIYWNLLRKLSEMAFPRP